MSTLIQESSMVEQGAQAVATRRRPRWRTIQALGRSRTAVFGAISVMLFVAIAIVGPTVVPYSPNEQNLPDRLQPPTWRHWMGTDELGRDVLTRIVVGARISLFIGLSATVIALVGGTLLGMVGAYFGGRLGELIMRGMDILLAFPGVLLAIIIVATLGVGLTNVVIAIGIHSIPAFARLAHGSTLGVKENEYVLAARALGTGEYNILRRHILPNIAAPLIVQFSLRVGTVILLAAGLGFLGLGAQPPTPEWGTMLSNARSYMRTNPHVGFFPGMAIFLVVLGLNLLGDGLRDVLDPRLRSG